MSNIVTGIDLVANDTGGAVAQIFAARHPHRLATFTLTNCDTSGNLPPESFKPVVELAAAGQLAPTTVAMFADPDAIIEKVRRGKRALESIHSHVRHYQMQASEFVAFLQAPVSGSSRQGRWRGRRNDG